MSRLGNDLFVESTKTVTDEHINENIIRNRSDEYWYSNVFKKTPRERFFFSFSIPIVRLSSSSGTFGRRENIARLST